MISVKFWSRMYKLDFFIQLFLKKPKNSDITKNTRKILETPKFTNFQCPCQEKIEFTHSRPKFDADHESALRIFKNESKI